MVRVLTNNPGGRQVPPRPSGDVPPRPGAVPVRPAPAVPTLAAPVPASEQLGAVSGINLPGQQHVSPVDTPTGPQLAPVQLNEDLRERRKNLVEAEADRFAVTSELPQNLEDPVLAQGYLERAGQKAGLNVVPEYAEDNKRKDTIRLSGNAIDRFAEVSEWMRGDLYEGRLRVKCSYSSNGKSMGYRYH